MTIRQNSLLYQAVIVFFSILITQVFIGCGEDESGDSGPGDYITTIVESDENLPIEYQLANDECQVAKDEIELTSGFVRTWRDDSVATEEIDFTSTRTKASLSSHIVERTLYDVQYERVCDLERGPGQACRDSTGREKGWRRVSSERNLRVCQDRHEFGRETYEGVALTALHHVHQAHGAFERNSNIDTGSFAKITLSVLPSFVDYYQNFRTDEEKREKQTLKTYITHNMAYFPAINMIAVFPEKESNRDKMAGFFWESEFVLGHEYGHYLDHMLQSGDGDGFANALQWNPLTHKFEDMDSLKLGLGADTARSQIRGALAEAFADLSAWYSVDGKDEGLAPLPCFGKNRIVRESSFANGDTKQLTDDRLSKFYGLTEAGPRECGSPNYGDIHYIGAIIAHTVDRSFASITARTPDLTPQSPEDYSARYGLAVKWMQKTLASYGQAAQSENTESKDLWNSVSEGLTEVVADAFTSFALTDTDVIEQIRTDVCNIVRENLGAAGLDSPFAPESGSCSDK